LPELRHLIERRSSALAKQACAEPTPPQYSFHALSVIVIRNATLSPSFACNLSQTPTKGSDVALTDAFAQPVPKRRGPICGMHSLKHGLSPDDLKALNAAIDLVRANVGLSSNYTVAWLHTVLQGEGYEIGLHTVSRHVRQHCSCGN